MDNPPDSKEEDQMKTTTTRNSTSAAKVFALLGTRVTRPASALAIGILLLAVTSASAAEPAPTKLDSLFAMAKNVAAEKGAELKQKAAEKAVCIGLKTMIATDSATYVQRAYYTITCNEEN